MIDFELEFKNWLLQVKGFSKLTAYEYIRILKKLMRTLYIDVNWDFLKRDKDDLLFFYMLVTSERYRQYLTANTKTNNIKDLTYFNRCLYFYNTIYTNSVTNSKMHSAFLMFYMFSFKDNKQYNNHFSRKQQEVIEFIERIIINNFGKQQIYIEDIALYLNCSALTVKRLLSNKTIKFDSKDIINYVKNSFYPSKYNKNINFRCESCCTVNEAAELLNCSITTIKRYIHKRLLGYIRYSERNIKIIRKDLLRLKNITLKEKI